MSAGVLAVLDRTINGEDFGAEAGLIRVRDRVQELIDADKEYDLANARLKAARRCGPDERVRRLNRVFVATSRRQAAINACAGTL